MSKGPYPRNNDLGVFLGCLLLVVVVLGGLGLTLLVILMFVWNITDIIDNGANFWNVFWLVLASFMGASMLASSTGAAARQRR